jgi:hypothetical protein
MKALEGKNSCLKKIDLNLAQYLGASTWWTYRHIEIDGGANEKM